MIGLCIPIMEGLAPLYDLHKVGLPIMLLNGLLAFSLNVAGVFLIDSAGSLVLTLSGVFKDILLITFSVVLMGSPITGTQIFGKPQDGIWLLALELTSRLHNDSRGHHDVQTHRRKSRIASGAEDDQDSGSPDRVDPIFQSPPSQLDEHVQAVHVLHAIFCIPSLVFALPK